MKRISQRASACATAVLLLAFLASSCSKIEEPHVVLSGIELEGLSKEGIEFTLMTDVTNPNDFGADIGRIEYRVEVDGTEIAKGRRSAVVSIPAGETAEVGVPFALTWSGLEKGLDRFFDGGDHEWKLTGSAELRKGALSKTFRFAETGEFKGPDARDLDFDL